MNKDQRIAESSKLIESFQFEGIDSDLERTESFTKEAATLSFNSTSSQALAIGSQIAEFGSGIDSGIRSDITNSLLLAQLAANKATPDGAAAAEWRENFSKVLMGIGWQFVRAEVGMQSLSTSGLEVHKAIIPVLTAALGPGVAASALVVQVLNGLAEIDKDQPWITLFNRESRRASVHQFQISYVQSDDEGVPLLNLIFFELDAEANVTQVLFFKSSNSSGTLYHSKTDLRIDPQILASIAYQVNQKVSQHISRFVSLIDI